MDSVVVAVLHLQHPHPLVSYADHTLGQFALEVRRLVSNEIRPKSACSSVQIYFSSKVVASARCQSYFVITPHHATPTLLLLFSSPPE